MTGGIGEFSISMGKEGSSKTQGSGNFHYIILMKQEWEQVSPLKFNNGFLDDLRTKLKLKAKIPLPEMPNFFPSGSEGEIQFQGRDVLRAESALRDQPLLAHLETLRILVQQCVDRKCDFPRFVAELNKLPIPSTWRNEIVNGLFETAGTVAPLPSVPKPPGLSQDIEKLMGLLSETEPDSLAKKVNPHFGNFLEEVGRESTGYTLKSGAGKRLHDELTLALNALRSNLLRQKPLAETLGFIASLQRLARLAKGREKQMIHLWSSIPANPEDLLVGENMDEGKDFALAIVLTDPLARTPQYLQQLGLLIRKLNCALLIQLPDSISVLSLEYLALEEFVPKASTYFFAGGVAARVDEEACVMRPAALAFLEGLVEAKEVVDFYLHRKMILEDQDLLTEKTQAYSTDKLLDQAAVTALSENKINRVNGARNQSIATFPILTSWAGIL